MAKDIGREFPERPLMGVLSDLVGIRHFTTSKGATVRRDFLDAVAIALGLPQETVLALRLKDEVLAVVVEAATHEPMDLALLSPGATVTNEVLQVIIDGITRNGIRGRPRIPVVEPRYLDVADGLAFNMGDLRDERDRRLVEMAVREGQDHFRSALMEAYGSRCAITGYHAQETLDAVHVYPYTGPATNHVTNGLLLRNDIHRLYDRGAIAVHENTRNVLVKPHLMVTEYADLAESRLRLPREPEHHPSTAALRSHREWAGFM